MVFIIPLLKLANEDLILWRPVKFIEKIELAGVLSLAVTAYLVPFSAICIFIENRFFKKKIKFVKVYSMFFVVSVFIPFIIKIIK